MQRAYVPAFLIVMGYLLPAGAAAAGDGPCGRRDSRGSALVRVPCSERLAGSWSGLLTETNGASYRADISLSKSGSGTISYGRLNCSGTLAYRSRQGARYSYRETITEGVATCTTGGDIVLEAVKPDGSTLDFHWTGSSLAVDGRVLGVMTAGITDGANTSSSPGGDGKDRCTRYLPNRESWVPMPCGETDEEAD